MLRCTPQVSYLVSACQLATLLQHPIASCRRWSQPCGPPVPCRRINRVRYAHDPPTATLRELREIGG